jgi:hypothetical protein
MPPKAGILTECDDRNYWHCSIPELQEEEEAESSFLKTGRPNRWPASGRTKKAGIQDSGLIDHEMVAGVRFELTTFGLCDLTQLSLRVGLYLHPA